MIHHQTTNQTSDQTIESPRDQRQTIANTIQSTDSITDDTNVFNGCSSRTGDNICFLSALRLILSLTPVSAAVVGLCYNYPDTHTQVNVAFLNAFRRETSLIIEVT